MEIVDPITGATPEWEQFVASLDPARLEGERFGRPGRDERPGSAGWRRMVEDHNARRHAYYRVPRPISDFEMALMLGEVRRYDRRFALGLTPRHIEIAERALRRQEGHAA